MLVGIVKVGGIVLEVGGVVVVVDVVVVLVVGGVSVVSVGDAVVPVVALDLQAEASETDARAVPAATMAALFRNCRLEYLVTR